MLAGWDLDLCLVLLRRGRVERIRWPRFLFQLRYLERIEDYRLVQDATCCPSSLPRDGVVDLHDISK